jgi:hypothetical protein
MMSSSTAYLRKKVFHFELQRRLYIKDSISLANYQKRSSMFRPKEKFGFCQVLNMITNGSVLHTSLYTVVQRFELTGGILVL